MGQLPAVTRHTAAAWLIICVSSVGAQPSDNPAAPRLPVFDSVAQMQQACESMLSLREQEMDELKALPLEQGTQETVLGAWDDMLIHYRDVAGSLALHAALDPDEAMRETAEHCRTRAGQLQGEQYQDKAVYERIQAAVPQRWEAIKLRNDLLRAFENSGVALEDDRRSQLRVIKDAINRLDQEFETRIRNNTDTVRFARAEQAGLPPEYIERVGRDADGSIDVTLTDGDFKPFMASATDADARRRYYRAFMNRGGERNVEIMRQINGLRARLAEFHEREHFADYVLRSRMHGSAEDVQDFLQTVKREVDAKSREELLELRQIKARDTGRPVEQVRINAWDLDFYSERLRQARYSVDQESLRKYFPMPETLDWLFALVEDLYGLRIVEEQAQAWHPDVRFFRVEDSRRGLLLGSFYTDLYPRQGKYEGAAAFDVRKASLRAAQRPISVLVANLDTNGLTMSDVETLFHEFGHVLHGLFAQTYYSIHGGVSVNRDFVEAPSQMFEEWARRPETLRRLSDGCDRCPEMEPELIEKLDAARRFGIGLHYARQILYARYDMALAAGQSSEPLALWEELESEYPLGHVSDTAFPGTFGHITGGYAAAYYGYLWSQAIALDMLSTFDEGLMDAEQAEHFRFTVLARGSERDPAELLKKYLGREPGMDALITDIRGERSMLDEPASETQASN